METKHEKFLRLSTNRVEKAVYHIGLIANLASHNYEYSEQEAENVISELRTAVDLVAAAFDLKTEIPEPENLPVPQPEPEPEPEDVPEEVVKRNEGPFTRGWAQWAYETLRRGEKKEAEGMLLRALQGDKY